MLIRFFSYHFILIPPSFHLISAFPGRNGHALSPRVVHAICPYAGTNFRNDPFYFIIFPLRFPVFSHERPMHGNEKRNFIDFPPFSPVPPSPRPVSPVLLCPTPDTISGIRLPRRDASRYSQTVC